MMRRRKPKQNAKRVNYTLIPKDSVAGRPMYKMLNELIEKHHEELTNARFALAWNRAWKPDADGRVTLGKCKKASDLDKELAAYDFVIILQAEFFQSGDVTEAQRRALLDHELTHATIRVDKDGEPVVDERGRTQYRIRKHDIEEFEGVIRRNGVYKRDLETFAKTILGLNAKQLKLPRAGDDKAAEEKPPKTAEARA